MAKNFICDGKKLTVKAAAAVVSGQALKVGSLIVVAEVSADANEELTASYSGVYLLPKKSADVVPQGAALYWDATNSELTITSTSNTLAGYAYEAAAASTVTVACRLVG